MKFLRFALVGVLILPVVLLCVAGMLAHGAVWSFMMGWKVPQLVKRTREQKIFEELEKAWRGPNF